MGADGFAASLLHEAGEAIGNVGRRLLRRRHRRHDAEEALERWRERVPAPIISTHGKARCSFDGTVIDATSWRVINDEEGETDE